MQKSPNCSLYAIEMYTQINESVQNKLIDPTN